MHEFATDPEVNLGYVAHYAGGIRVLSFGNGGFEQVGKYVDHGGNNFWGVEQFTGPDGSRLIAGSDRDFGLYIVKYTGPGAPVPPSAPLAASPAPPAAPAAAPRDATKPRVGLLSAGRQRMAALRGAGFTFRIRADEASSITVTLRGRVRTASGRLGKTQTIARATVARAAAGQTATVRLRPSASMRSRLRSQRRLSAVLSVRVTDLAGNVSTRTKAMSFR